MPGETYTGIPLNLSRNVSGLRVALAGPSVIAALVVRAWLLRGRVRRPGVLPTKGRRTTRRLRGLHIKTFYEECCCAGWRQGACGGRWRSTPRWPPIWAGQRRLRLRRRPRSRLRPRPSASTIPFSPLAPHPLRARARAHARAHAHAHTHVRVRVHMHMRVHMSHVTCTCTCTCTSACACLCMYVSALVAPGVVGGDDRPAWTLRLVLRRCVLPGKDA